MCINLMINATALNSRGGLTVTKKFIEEINEYLKGTDQFQITIIVSVNEFVKYSNKKLNIIFNDLPKKGPIQKYRFEKRELPRIIKEAEASCYLSFANTFLTNCDIPQYVLIHQPLPFSNLRFNEINISTYIKYNFILNLFYKYKLSNKVNGIIVQTQWMKEAIQVKYNYRGNIRVIRPLMSSIDVNERLKPLFSLNINKSEKLNPSFNFLYPTSNDKYKNTNRLVEAINKYNTNAKTKATLYLTIEGENSEFVKYIGKVPYESMYWLYKQMDALMFPSLTETLGLPLQEALDNKIDILAADLPYAREVCGNHADYFDPRSVESIIKTISNYSRSQKRTFKIDNKLEYDSYLDFLNFIMECEQEKTLASY